MNNTPTNTRERNDYEAADAVRKAIASELAKMIKPTSEAIAARRALDKAQEEYRAALLEAIRAARVGDY